jgi:hypothetical protein
MKIQNNPPMFSTYCTREVWAFSNTSTPQMVRKITSLDRRSLGLIRACLNNKVSTLNIELANINTNKEFFSDISPNTYK